MAELRDYQKDLIDEARLRLRTCKTVLIQGSTGMGKTVLSSFMLKSLAEQNKRGLFICHRRELIKQTSNSFNEFNIDHAIIATSYKSELNKPIQICSVGSLANKVHLIKSPDFIIWDECHHLAASTWSKIFNYFPDALHVGLTATPQRLDGKGLGEFFEKMVQAIPMKELINQGYLSDFDIYAPSQPDLSGVKSKSGDYVPEALDKAVNKPTITGCAIEHYKKICSGKKAVVFCASVNHSLNVVQKFNDNGIEAAHVDGKMTNKQRDTLIDRFKSGDLKILSNVDIVGEGFDLPAIEVAILLRPTQSLTLYLQQVGRALRKAKGKDKAIILDHAGNSLNHGVPDSNYTWSLDNDFIEGPKEARKVSNDKSCPKCSLVVTKARVECDCGYNFRKINLIESKEGSLHLINKEFSGCVNSKLSPEDIGKFIRLYNQGYKPSDAIVEVWNIDKANRKALKNRGCITSDIILGKTWKDHPIRPISRDDWLDKNLNYRFHNSYDINEDGCFITKFRVTPSGHIQLKYNNKTLSCKKYSYESKYHKLEKSETLLATCGRKDCVNPDHFTVISNSERAILESKKRTKEEKRKAAMKGVESLLRKYGQEGVKEFREKGLKKAQALKRISYDIEEIKSGVKRRFDSAGDAAKYIGCVDVTVAKYSKFGKPYKGYLIKSYLPF